MSNNLYSTLALIVAVVVLTIYLTKESTKDKELLERIYAIENQRLEMKRQVDSIYQYTNAADGYLIGQIDSLYNYIEIINARKALYESAIKELDQELKIEEVKRNERKRKLDNFYSNE